MARSQRNSGLEIVAPAPRKLYQIRPPKEAEIVIHPRARGSHVGLPYDPIFFRKIDIRVGAYLVHLGRLHAGTRWRITRITTDIGLGRGLQSVQECHKLNDTITLRLDDGQGRKLYGALMRQATFGYLSYSAIWRLAPHQEPEQPAMEGGNA